MRKEIPASSGGFTLVELMIVCAAITIVAVISIPNVIEARKSSNESTAIAALRTIASAQAMFREGDKDGDGLDYADNLADLGTYGLVDPPLASGTRNGYDFSIAAADGWTWSANADPAVRSKTGDRSFFIDETGVIRFNTSAPAGPADPEIGL